MNAAGFENFDVLERRVQEMVNRHQLPPPINGFDVKFGEMRDGDPAVWIRLHTPVRENVSDAEAEIFANLMINLSRELRELVPGRSAFTTIINQEQATA